MYSRDVVVAFSISLEIVTRVGGKRYPPNASILLMDTLFFYGKHNTKMESFRLGSSIDRGSHFPREHFPWGRGDSGVPNIFPRVEQFFVGVKQHTNTMACSEFWMKLVLFTIRFGFGHRLPL